MFFPIGTDRPQRRLPLMNIALIALNVIFFLASRDFTPHPGLGASPGGLSPGWDKYMLNGPGGLQLYQFITYQFLHADISHIGFNMLFLYVFGNNLNEKLGHVAYLLFYLAGGVCAGCGQVAISGGATLGASGSISAVAGLFLVLLPRTHIRIIVWLFVYGDVWEIPSMYFILFKIGQDVFEQVVGGEHVAYMAHISGTAAGFLIGVVLLGTKLVQRDHYDLLALINRQRRRQAYRSVVAQGYDPFDPVKTSPVRAGSASKLPAAVDPRIGSLRDEIARLLRNHESRDAAKRYLELLAVDPEQVLASQEQLDVSSQLMAEQNYAAAAKGFEDYLRFYPSGGAGQQEQITLMLAMIYGQYLENATRARELLSKVLPRLHNSREKEMAEAELKRLGGAV